MRPHRLRLQAFGSFAGQQELDLDSLAESGVFLLHGETGAGKSTLLDAICFALYGRVPRHGSRAGRLRSDHAHADVRTEVELEVTLCGRRLLLVRRPAQERAKSRGDGTTTEQASVRLSELRGGVWEPVSQRLDEVGAELELLLGMTADQFQQVVLLPQGQFAAFLQADTKQRAELLQRLFATERFADVERWLVELRGRTGQRVQAAQQAADVLAARYAQAAGCDVPAEPDQAWVAELLARHRRTATDDALAASQARERHEQAREALEAARDLVARQARRRAQVEVLAGLDAQQPVVDALAVELAAAARAAELAGGLTEADRRDALSAAATAAQTERRARLGALADAPVEELQAAAEEAGRRIGLLEGLQGQAAALAEEHRAVEALTTQADAAAETRRAAEHAVAALPAQVVAAEAALAAARQAADALPAAEQAARDLAAALREARALGEVVHSQAQVGEQHLTAREHAADLREHATDLRAARLDGMRAELADALAEGDPCPVCGSAEHPDPYLGSADRVTHEAQEQAQAAAEQARQQVAALETALAALQATSAQHAARLAELALGDDPAALTVALATASADLPAMRVAAAGLGPAEQALAAVLELRSGAQEQVTRAITAQEVAVERAQDAAQRRARAADALASHLEGALSLEVALSQARTAEALLDGAVTAASLAATAADEARAAQAVALTAARAAGFTDLAQARVAARTPAWRQQAQDQHRAHAESRAAVLAALADPDLDVPLEPPTDLGARTTACAQADQERLAAEAALTRSSQRAHDLELLAPELAQALDELVPLEREAAEAKALADLCTGTSPSNALRMSLSSFVLAARLEQVAEVASQRLLTMTQGRFSLVHSDGAAGHGRRSGLGLRARDTWTGQDRDTSTLSGGETFLAALALALGLADVVQQEAGGARIDALFVDEGFGTLDDQALDLAMDVLDGLRAGGRVVGIVSHVAELRARIPAQVKVHKGKGGSTVELVRAG